MASSAQLSKIDNVTLFIGFTSQLISYILEPATAEELTAYQKAKEETEDKENEEE